MIEGHTSCPCFLLIHLVNTSYQQYYYLLSHPLIDCPGQSGKVVSRMLNTAVSAGKRVRSETGISKGAVSISSAAAEFTEMKVCAQHNLLTYQNSRR